VDDKRLSKLRDRTVMVHQPAAKVKHFVTRAASVRLGQARLKDVPVSLFQDPANDAPLAVDGVIGNGLLRRFRVTIDLSNHRLILEPGALVDVPYDYDLTGFTIVANGQVFGLGSVEHGTSADRAGLRPGDVIEELDGRPVRGMRLADLQRAFVQDGRDRQLKIRRLGVERTTTLAMFAIR
jgi:S1-C subfamily serine protease